MKLSILTSMALRFILCVRLPTLHKVMEVLILLSIMERPRHRNLDAPHGVSYSREVGKTESETEYTDSTSCELSASGWRWTGLQIVVMISSQHAPCFCFLEFFQFCKYILS